MRNFDRCVLPKKRNFGGTGRIVNVTAFTSEYSGAVTLSIPLKSSAYDEVRVFVWNSLSGMYPLTKVEYPVATS